jgi:hypothetical protein
MYPYRGPHHLRSIVGPLDFWTRRQEGQETQVKKTKPRSHGKRGLSKGNRKEELEDRRIFRVCPSLRVSSRQHQQQLRSPKKRTESLLFFLLFFLLLFPLSLSLSLSLFLSLPYSALGE